MPSIFSTYSSGENRVTASFIAVLRSLSLDRIQRMLAAIIEESEFQLIRFDNQPSKGGQGVPDAIIQSSVRLLIETKTERDAVGLDQINRHLARLEKANEANKVLLVFTPDDSCPDAIDELNDDRIRWVSFAAIDQAIDEMLEDKREVVSERESFLLRELQEMFSVEGLLKNPNDVVVVAARIAWQEYNAISAYVCQANRSFQQVERISFYSKGNIYPLVPKILKSHDDVEMARNRYEGMLGEVVNAVLDKRFREEGQRFKIMILSAPDSPETLKLDRPIPNDKKSKSGKGTAFTMSQRYVSSDALRNAKTTTDLDG